MAWLPDSEKISKISLFVLTQLKNVTDTRGWRGGLVVERRTCDLVVAGSRPGRDAAA